MTATTEPAVVTAGDTVAWVRDLPDYPAPAWVLAYTYINAASKITVTAGASGAQHAVSVAAATTAGWAAGTYAWAATATNGAQRATVARGTLQVLPNLAAATTLDVRSPAQQALDDVNAALRTYGAKAWMQSLSIAGRSQTFRSASEFMAFRSQLEAEVAKEQAAARLAAGLQPSNRLLVRFAGRRV